MLAGGGGGGADVYFLRISEGKKLLVMLSAAHSEEGEGADQLLGTHILGEKGRKTHTFGLKLTLKAQILG